VESIAGANKRLTLPDGRTLDVAIPSGLTEGQVLRLRGKGAPGSGKGGSGDTRVEVEIKPDRSFTRQGDTTSIWNCPLPSRRPCSVRESRFPLQQVR
jgi:DnaJ-class molecular chaperone